jgi:carbon starvation protein
LLAALTLLTLSVWLKKSGRRFAFALVPMLFVLSITLWALLQIAWSSFRLVRERAGTAQGFGVELANGIASVVLTLVALFLVSAAVARLREPRAAPAQA